MTTNEILAARLEKLDKMKSNPKFFAACVVHYRESPADFISDWVMTLDPRKNPPVMPFILWERQKEYIEWMHGLWKCREDGLCEKSRDSGITWLSAAFALWLWLFHDSQVIGFGSRKEDFVDKKGDPDSIFEKIRFMLRNIPSIFIPHDYLPKQHDTHMRIINPLTESVIKGEAGDNIGRGGRASIFIVDESAFLERSEVVEAALSQNSDCKIHVSTPNGVGNVFYRKRFGGGVSVFTFKWTDDPRKDQAWFDKQKRNLDPVILAQEVLIDYNASVDNAFIAGDLVDDAQCNRSTDFDLFNQPLVLGVDVARFGQDKSVICARQGRVVHYLKSYNKIDTMQLCGEVCNIINYSDTIISAIFVDVIGIGAGVFDRLAEIYGGRIIPVNVSERSAFEHYKNKRTEIWALMRDWFANGPVSIPNDSLLRAELTALQYTYNSTGQLELESKDKAKKRGVRSPDHADALALTFALPSYALSVQDDHFEYQEDFVGRSAVTGY